MPANEYCQTGNSDNWKQRQLKKQGRSAQKCPWDSTCPQRHSMPERGGFHVAPALWRHLSARLFYLPPTEKPGGAAHRKIRMCRPRSGHPCARSACRSEEHTSELQSLMRITYADCCLK